MEARIDALVEKMWSLVRRELEAAGVQGVGRAAADTDETTEDTVIVTQPRSEHEPVAKPLWFSDWLGHDELWRRGLTYPPPQVDLPLSPL